MVGSLRCEYSTNPVGIDTQKVRLSWKIRDDKRGACQTAYQIQVAESAEDLDAGKLLWDSGRVESDQSILVPYEGPTPGSRERRFWRVQVWGKDGTPYAISETGHWEMGLLEASDWQAKWVQTEIIGGKRSMPQVPALRTTFEIDQPIRSAALYVTALGMYRFFLNGQRVGDHELAPGWTDYNERVRYQVFDVSDILSEGVNAAGAWLGDGWWCGYVSWQDRQSYGDRPMLLAQLEITLADGSRQMVRTDESWKWSYSPILESDMLMGEVYDARREQDGWCESGFDDAKWHPVELAPAPDIALIAMQSPPIRVVDELKPIERLRDGRAKIFDLGQNMVGRIRIKARGKAGTNIKLRYAEILQDNGDLYVENLRTAKSTDYFTKRSNDEETYESVFTFHGFRYFEVTGLESVECDDITGVVLCSDMAQTGDFECSDELVNQLQKNIQWGQRGNFLDVPTDCPQRDERLGWTGDAQVFVRTAAFNMDVSGFFAKWQQDVTDAQNDEGAIPPVCPKVDLGGDSGPAWADAAVICPWTMYLCYGDTKILDDHYDTMAKFVQHMVDNSKDLVRSHPDLDYWGGFGDWLAMDNGGETIGLTPKDLIGTAFFAYDADLMVKIATILGKEDDAQKYRDLRDRVRAVFQERYVTAGGMIHGNTQTCYLLALHFGLLTEEQEAIAAAELVRDIRKRGMHISAGFVGSPYINHVLSKHGYNDVAYALLAQKQWPSWLYAVTQGATTIWERWNGWTHDKGFANPGMNSFNHYAYGAIGDWLYQTVAGLRKDDDVPAYKKLVIAPTPGDMLDHAKVTLETSYGLAESGWQRDADELVVKVKIPANAEAVFLPPTEDINSITEGGKALSDAEGVAVSAGKPEIQLKSGNYEFRIRG